MAKNGLGKSLGALMEGDAVAGNAPRRPDLLREKTGQPPGRGFSTLVAPKPAAVARPAHRELLPAWFYFAADILLLAYSVAIIFRSPRPLDPGAIGFCAAAITLGAMLGVAGVLKSTSGPSGG